MTQGQTIDWTVLEKGMDEGMFVGFNEDGGYTKFIPAINKKKTARFRILDADHKLITEIEADSGFDKWHRDRFSVLPMKAQSYIIQNRFTRPKGVDLRSYVAAGDAENIQKGFQPLADFSWSTKGRVASGANMPYGRTSYDYQAQEISPDGTKLLLTEVQKDAAWDADVKEAFTVYVYDDSMKEVWSKAVRLEYSDKQLAIKDQYVLDSGEVLILGIAAKNKEAVLIKISKDEIKEHKFRLETGLPKESYLFVDKYGNIYAAGLYQKDSKSLEASNGFYMASFAADGSKRYVKSFAYGPEVIERACRPAAMSTGTSKWIELGHPYHLEEEQLFSFVCTNSVDLASGASSPSRTVSRGFIVPVFDLESGDLNQELTIDRQFDGYNGNINHSVTYIDHTLFLFFENELGAEEGANFDYRLVNLKTGGSGGATLTNSEDESEPEIMRDSFLNGDLYGYSGIGTFQHQGQGKFLIYGLKDRMWRAGWLQFDASSFE